MKKKITALMVIIALLIVACSTHVHTIGTGPETGIRVTARQFYLLYGLIPLNTVNTDEMADNSANYEIQTQVGIVDVGIAVGLGIVTLGVGPTIVQSRTVTVTK
jgi:hypothetical protein|tara:strand:- start:1913 stop:2224 length:312 start_codon:yes stop_codon:yes gene_type:complete